jgi:hypothetical protein
VPNWVDNALTIQGPPEELARFSAQASEGYHHPFGGYVDDRVLSFWNFAKPEDLKEYQDVWYDWNLNNWGCKWDASEPHLEESVGELMYWFNTPWGQPTEALEAMSKQYPALVMTMRSIEEQGWGCEYIADQDGVRLIKEWDIPDTHEDSMKHKGWCNCEEMRDDEMEWMYEDCPKKKELANA